MCYTQFRMSQVLDSDNSILFSERDNQDEEDKLPEDYKYDRD